MGAGWGAGTGSGLGAGASRGAGSDAKTGSDALDSRLSDTPAAGSGFGWGAGLIVDSGLAD